MAPRELAEELAAAATTVSAVERTEIAGPGFVNLWVTDAWLADALAEVLERGRDFGPGEPATRERVQVEMVSANPTGPITVASARNGAYGDSVARLLEFAGHEVEREYYYNDGGTQMEKFRASVEARRRGDEPPEDGYQGAYIDELAASDEDPVPKMLEQIEQTLDRFRVHFDSPGVVNLVDRTRLDDGFHGRLGHLRMPVDFRNQLEAPRPFANDHRSLPAIAYGPH
jgi:arginyl-tRNA synthetase